jgi:tRNA (guanine37-N1)-methyltransferase
LALQITVVTLFPEVFTYLESSILKRARDRGLLIVDFVNPRDFTTDRHRTVDDMPYGGGPGMVLKPEPIFLAVNHIRQVMGNRGKIILTTPAGKRFDQETASLLAAREGLVFLCGHYEGFDHRIHTLADLELSIGDYVLTGGELPVMVMVDAIARMIPGVIDPDSARMESFQDGLLDFPQYTRPPVFEGMTVPPVLLSGNHEKIRRWRRKEAIKRTLNHRPDLLIGTHPSREDAQLIDEIIGESGGSQSGIVL